MKTLLIAASVALAGVTTSHAQVFRPSVGGSAAVGAIAGSLIGGHNGDRWAEGAILGGVAGALIGAAVAPQEPVYATPPPVYQAPPVVYSQPAYGQSSYGQPVYNQPAVVPAPTVDACPPQVVAAPPPVVYVEPSPRVVYVPAPPPVVYVRPPVSFGFGYSYGYRHYGPGYRGPMHYGYRR